jgi:thiosulfate/3-mercaptopyruvate sulfurtransferase
MIAVSLLTVVLAADPVAYAKPELLIDAATVKADGSKYHLVDVRPATAFAQGHVAGSRHAELAKWGKALGEDKADEAFWKVQLKAAGVTPTKPVVVIGSDVREVCRGWWLLKYAGVKDVKVLNGGIDAFTKAGGPLTEKLDETEVPAHDWKRDTGRLAKKTDLIVSIDDKLAQIVDARATGEFTGTQAMAKKGGHVPGAAHLEWKDYLDDAGKFKSAADLKSLIAAKKIDLTKACTTYCQSGGRASVAAFALELMGAKGVKNYYASWSEWGNAADTPVEK